MSEMTQQAGDAGEHRVHRRRLPVLSGLHQARRARRRRVGEARIVDDAPPADMPVIGHHQRRHADRRAPARRPFGDAPHRISGSDGHSIECRSNSTSTVSISGRISRARSSSMDRRGPSSTATSHTRLMSSSTNRDAVGWRGSNRSNAARLTKPNVSRPRAGASPARSSRSSTIAPAISLPCVSASSATCGPGRAGSTRGEAAHAGIAVQPGRDVRRGESHLECGQRRLRDRRTCDACRSDQQRSARRRMNASQASSWSCATHSSGWCAWAMWPGPQMIVGMPAPGSSRPRCRS